MRLIRNFSRLALAVTLCVLFYAAGSGAAYAAPISHSHPASTSQPPTGAATWVQNASPYVHMVNHLAIIDPTISQHLSANEVTLTQNAVRHYNNLPLSLRQEGRISGNVTLAPAGKVQPNCCVYQWTLNWYWWGARVWLNSPAAQNFSLAMTVIGAGLGAALGAGIGTVPGAVIGAILGAITGVAAAFVDNECGNRGIFVDINWALLVSLNPVC
jgi:hypothetical protein